MTQQPCLYPKKLPTGVGGDVHSYLLIVPILRCVHYCLHSCCLHCGEDRSEEYMIHSISCFQDNGCASTDCHRHETRVAFGLAAVKIGNYCSVIS